MLPSELAGKYEERGTLGAGAMGTVVEAFDRMIERRVAVKLVKLPSGGDAEAEEAHARFRREAQAAGRLSHPNIVGVYDYGENADTAWIVMEMVEGGTLKGIIDRGDRMPVPEIVRVMDQVLAALAYSHGRGVVHRDIKPANLMLAGDRTVKIADFGIARIENSSMTQVGTVMGTPSYMAPEQLRGEPVDARADIWAAGVVLYQLLTGEKPFEGNYTALMHRVLNTEPPPPSQLSVSAPRALDAVVARALAKRPDDRFASAAAFAEAIRGAASGAPSAEATGSFGFAGAGPLPGLDDATMVASRGAAPPPPPAPAPKPAPPAKSGGSAPLVIGGGVAALAAAGVAAFFLMGRDPAPGPAPTTVASLPPIAQPVVPPVVAPVVAPEPTPVSPVTNPSGAAPVPSPPVTGPAPATPAAPPVAAMPPAGLGVLAPPVVAPSVPGPSIAAPSITAPAVPGPSIPGPSIAAPPIAAPPAMAATPPVAAPIAPSGPLPSAPVTAMPTPAAPVQPAPTQPAPTQAAPVQPAPAAPVAVSPTPVSPAPASPSQAPPAQAATPAPSPAADPQPAKAPIVAALGPPAAPARPPASQPAAAPVPPRIDFRAAAQAAATVAPCSLLSGSAGDQALTVSGVLRRGGEVQIRRSLVERGVPLQSATLDLQPFEGPYCGALDVIRQVAATAGEAPGVGILGTMPLQRGDLLRMDVQLPDRAAHLYVSYIMKSAEIVHLVPSQPHPPGVRVRLGEPRPGFPGWEVDEPYGTDLIIVFASDRPLFPQARPVIEPLDDYLAALGAALRDARMQGNRVAARAVVVETVARR